MHATAHHCPVCGVPTPNGRCPVHGVSGVALAPAQLAFAPGAVLLGRYRIDLALGVHGTQASFLATQLDAPRQVVIEALGVPRLAHRAVELAALFRESRVASLFSRADLVRVLDFGVEPFSQQPVLVMEYVQGRPVQEIIAPGSAEKRTAASFVEVCHGLLDADDEQLLDPNNPIPTAVPGYNPAEAARAPAAPPPALAPPRAPPAAPPAAAPAGTEDRRLALPRAGSAIRLSPGSSQERPAMPRPKKAAAPAPEPESEARGWSGVGLTVATLLVVAVIYVFTSDDVQFRPQFGPRVTKPTTYYREGGGRPPPGREPFQAPLGGAQSIKVDSQPGGAEAWAGARLLGRTPLSVPRPTGGGRLRITLKKKGFLDKQLTLHRDSDDEVDARLLGSEPDKAPELIGQPEVRDPLKGGNYGKNPLEKSPYDKSPLGASPFTNPFGKPGTSPVGRTETPEDTDDPDETP